MPVPPRERSTDYADAAMAHNRWPTIGLFVGGGLGLVSSLVFVPGFIWSIVEVFGLAVLGCTVGWCLAMLVYRDVDRTSTGPIDDNGSGTGEEG